MDPEQPDRLAFSTTSTTSPAGGALPPPGAAAPTGPGRPNRRVAIAWKVFAGLMVIGALWWGTYNAVTLVAHEEYTEVTTYAADGVDSLMVGTPDGSLTVVASDGDEIRVTAHVSDGLRETGNRQEVVDGELQLDGSCPVVGSQWCSIGYTIELPEHIAVDIDSAQGSATVRGMRSDVDVTTDQGGIEVEDVVGDVRFDSQHGSIAASGLAADEVVARTDQGSIDLELAEAPRRVDAESDQGSVDVAVPDDDEAYQVDVHTDQGSDMTAIRTDPDGERSIRAVTDHGDVVVRYAADG